MSNPRITKKERGLLKGAIRRVFSRSDLRKAVIDATVVQGYSDPERQRVTKWSQCQSCHKMEARYLMQCDHKVPIIPVTSAFEDMSFDTVVDRTWCEQNNLWGICKTCHEKKTKDENKARRANKKGKKV